jgi:cell division protein FtsB
MKKLVLSLSIIFFIIFIVLVALTIFDQRGFIHMVRLREELEELENYNAKFISENEKLRQEIDLLKNDLRYLEEVARSELGLVKEGELVYHLEKNE